MRSRLLMIAAATVVSSLLAQSFGTDVQGEVATHAHSQHSPAEAWSSGTDIARSLYEATVRMHESMLRSPPSGNADVDFLSQIIPHHEGTVDMARVYLAPVTIPSFAAWRRKSSPASKLK